jgi:hypothetical protein
MSEIYHHRTYIRTKIEWWSDVNKILEKKFKVGDKSKNKPKSRYIYKV